MKVAKVELLIKKGPFAAGSEWQTIFSEVLTGIDRVGWPPGNRLFIINPSKGKGRGQGNGVRPIKQGFLGALEGFGWSVDERSNPRRFDAVKGLKDGRIFGLEWETGNVSSTHRSVNRIVLAQHDGVLRGGAVILPTREMYQYLTDRVGNWEEVEPYFSIWRLFEWDDGLLAMIGVEQDGVSEDVPRISKGTDGRALL